MGRISHIGTVVYTLIGIVPILEDYTVLALVIPIWEKNYHIGIQYGMFSYLVYQRMGVPLITKVGIPVVNLRVTKSSPRGIHR